MMASFLTLTCPCKTPTLQAELVIKQGNYVLDYKNTKWGQYLTIKIICLMKVVLLYG